MSLAKTVLKTACKIMGVKAYVGDFMSTQNHEFVDDPRFKRAYARGIQAAGRDYDLRWRAHVALWAATSASKLRGDFIECGVNKGFVSSAIMNYLDWDSLGKKFYLLDTYHGLDEQYVSAEEKAAGFLESNRNSLAQGDYTSDVDMVRKNFSEWKNAIVVQGTIPDSLKQVEAPEIAYLHLDLNCSPPEVAALEQLWDRLVPGGFVLHDDYGWLVHRTSKIGMDQFAAKKDLQFVTLPTGQGLLIKPH